MLWSDLSKYEICIVWSVRDITNTSRDREVSDTGFELLMQISWLHIQCAAS